KEEHRHCEGGDRRREGAPQPAGVRQWPLENKQRDRSRAHGRDRLRADESEDGDRTVTPAAPIHREEQEDAGNQPELIRATRNPNPPMSHAVERGGEDGGDAIRPDPAPWIELVVEKPD